MDFTIYGTWFTPTPVTEADAFVVNARFGPFDEDTCAWVDDAEPNALQVSFEVDASSLAEALSTGRSRLAEAASMVLLGGHAARVTAMGDDELSTWEAD